MFRVSRLSYFHIFGFLQNRKIFSGSFSEQGKRNHFVFQRCTHTWETEHPWRFCARKCHAYGFRRIWKTKCVSHASIVSKDMLFPRCIVKLPSSNLFSNTVRCNLKLFGRSRNSKSLSGRKIKKKTQQFQYILSMWCKDLIIIKQNGLYIYAFIRIEIKYRIKTRGPQALTLTWVH